MDSKTLADAINLSDIITHKLQGMANKIEIVADTKEDKQLAHAIDHVLKYQHTVSGLLKKQQNKNES